MLKLLISIAVIVVLVVTGFYFFTDGEKVTGKVVSNQEIRIEPLNSLERNNVVSAITESEMVKDLPKKGILALRFYSFDDRGRVWRDAFLIGKNGLLNEGDPDMFIGLHAKYIEQLESRNLCDIVSEAKTNGDMLFNSEKSKARLLIKFAGMLKYRECFGF